MASQTETRGALLRRRLPLVLAIVIGTVVWKGSFGFFATSREVTWRLEVPYAEVRRVVLEVSSEGAVLRREERFTPQGLTAELKQELVVRRGPHLAVASVWLAGAQQPLVFETTFDPGDASSLVLEFRHGQPPVGTAP